MKRLLFLLFLIILPTLHSYAQVKKTDWSLEDCLKYATKYNIAVKQAELTKKVYENNYFQSKLNLLPTVSANFSYGFDYGYSIDPTTYSYVKESSQTFVPTGQVNLNLFMGLTQLNTIKKDKYDLQAYNDDYLSSINSTALNVTNLFLQVVLNKELVKAAARQVDISQSQLDVAQAKIKAGTLAETAVYDFQAQLERDKAQVINQQNTEDLAMLTLRIALQLPDKDTFNIVIPEINLGPVISFDEVSVQDVYHYALRHQPSVKAAQARVTSALYSIKIAKGALSPTFSVSYNTHDDYFNKASTTNITGFSPNPPYLISTETPTSIGTQFRQNIGNDINFNMSIPIFTGWQRMTAIANARLQYQIQELSVENANNSLRKDVYQAYTNAKGYAQSYVANLKALESQRMAYETAQKRYDAGLAAAYELQQVQDNLARAESNAIQAKYNYIFSVKVLDFYQGKTITLN